MNNKYLLILSLLITYIGCNQEIDEPPPYSTLSQFPEEEGLLIKDFFIPNEEETYDNNFVSLKKELAITLDENNLIFYRIRGQENTKYTATLTTHSGDLDLYTHPSSNYSPFSDLSFSTRPNNKVDRIHFRTSEAGIYYLAIHAYSEGIGSLQIRQTEIYQYFDQLVQNEYSWISAETERNFGAATYGGVSAIRQCKAFVNFFIYMVFDKTFDYQTTTYRLQLDRVFSNNPVMAFQANVTESINLLINHPFFTIVSSDEAIGGDVIYLTDPHHYAIVLERSEDGSIRALDANWSDPMDGKLRIHTFNSDKVNNMIIGRLNSHIPESLATEISQYIMQ
jgi:hypothetical protein